MRIVALVSGGKDSIYNILECINAGHDVVALANISPELNDKDELDSFMFQTVGHEGVSLIAEAIGLPLYRQTTTGKACCEKLHYEPTANDEVEDLHDLLSRVKEETGCQGVGVGAIASDYQRTRVENICCRLSLTCFAYLWQQDQSRLLDSMIRNGIEAITIKVASAGLEPERHLGMSLKVLQPIVEKLSEKFGVNVCGEGGEYETFVLDCPLFHKKIILDETQITTDSTSGYIKIKSAKLEPKYGDASPSDSFEQRRSLSHLSSSSWEETLRVCRQLIPIGIAQKISPIQWENISINKNGFSQRVLQPSRTTQWFYLPAVATESIEDALTVAKQKLKENGLNLSDVVFVNLWLQNMNDFADVNRVYAKEFQNSAPPRACVAVASQHAIGLEVTASRKSAEKRVVHVQSVSHWAPANIGPYSQSYKIGGTIFLAGQIPLIPGLMTLFEEPLPYQLRLCLQHVGNILQVSNQTLKNVQQMIVFCSKSSDLQPAVMMLEKLLEENVVVSGFVVKSLPRFADVELLAVANEGIGIKRTETNKYLDCTFRTDLVWTNDFTALAIHAYLNEHKSEISHTEIEFILSTINKKAHHDLGLKIFFVSQVEGLKEGIERGLGEDLASLIPVTVCESPTEFMTIIALGTRCQSPCFCNSNLTP